MLAQKEGAARALEVCSHLKQVLESWAAEQQPQSHPKQPLDTLNRATDEQSGAVISHSHQRARATYASSSCSEAGASSSLRGQAGFIQGNHYSDG